MLQRIHQQFALGSKMTFLWNSRDLHPEPMQAPAAHEWLCALLRKRLKTFGKNPQIQAAQKGSEQQCPKTFPPPTKSLGPRATIDRQPPQQRSYRPLRHAPQGIPKRWAALLSCQE